MAAFGVAFALRRASLRARACRIAVTELVARARLRFARLKARCAAIRCSADRRSQRWRSKKRTVLRCLFAAASLRASRDSRDTARFAADVASRPAVAFPAFAVDSPFAAAGACVTMKSRHRPTNRVFSVYLPQVGKAETGARPQTGTARVARSGNGTQCDTPKAAERHKIIKKACYKRKRVRQRATLVGGVTNEAAGQGFEPQLPGPEGAPCSVAKAAVRGSAMHLEAQELPARRAADSARLRTIPRYLGARTELVPKRRSSPRCGLERYRRMLSSRGERDPPARAEPGSLEVAGNSCCSRRSVRANRDLFPSSTRPPRAGLPVPRRSRKPSRGRIAGVPASS
jgi:hypothetical protein